MDIIGFINTQSPVVDWPAQDKIDMLDDLAETHGYQENVVDENGDTVVNPESKKAFVNRMIVEQIKRWVNGWRKHKAGLALSVNNIDF